MTTIPESLQRVLSGDASDSEVDSEVLAYLAGQWAISLDAWPRVVAAARRGLQAATLPSLEAAAQAAARTAPQRTAPNAVAVISLQGVIRPRINGLFALLFGMTGGLEAFRSSFREALGDSSISSIVLDIDSPGGLTDMVPETAAMIREARGEKPITAVANTMAASAAYYIASAADEVVVTPSGFVGSIGVFTVHEDWSKFNEKFGVLPTYISAGKYKTEANPDAPLSDEAKAAMQIEVDEFYNMFVEDVATGRGTTASAVKSGYGEGRVLTARRAVDAHLADRVDTLEAVIGSHLAKAAEPAPAAALASAGNGGGASLTVDELFSEEYLRTHVALR